jgi:5-formyltetrahydrofolate cyclo-ligase
MTKAALRTHYKAARKALSTTEREEMSAQICARISQLVRPGQRVALFMPIAHQLEVDLTSLLDNRQVNWYVSRADLQRYEMTFYAFEDSNQLRENEWGIPEPQYGTTLSPDQFDVVLVPLLACDETGHRVGYGKGFYDRFLTRCTQHCVFIGVNYWSPVPQIGDVHEEDIRLHYLVTPTNLFTLR